MKVHYYADEGDYFSRSYLEAFKPGPWLPTLLDIVDRVSREKREENERWQEQSKRDQAERNFT